MNFDGFTPFEIPRFGSLVEQDDPTSIPIGTASLARNVKYHLTSVRTRDGISTQWGMKTGNDLPVTGMISGKLETASTTIYIPMVFDGTVYIESPVGSGNLTVVASSLVSPPANSSQQASSGFDKIYMAFTDLVNSMGAPAVYNLETSVLDPLSMQPVGLGWEKDTDYIVGEVVTPATPVGGNGHWYRCTTAGKSGGVRPTFPVPEGGTVVDGTVVWTEDTPLMVQAIPEPPIPTVIRSAGAGSFAASRDVYIIVTLENGIGETDAQLVLSYKYTNTLLNDRFIVTSPTLATWIQQLTGLYAVTGYNVYEADVATTTAAPALSAYTKVNVGPVAIGSPTNVDTTGLGTAPPTTNGASIVPTGNICAGLRYMVVLYLNRNGYISGYGTAAFATYFGSTSGYQLYVPHIPTGPANTAARILAFTPAGTLQQSAGYGISTAGPYFWIPPQGFADGDFTLSAIPGGVTVADVVSGIQMTSTLINDNTTTTGTFNFTDDYLKGTQEDVSAYFRKIQLQNVCDVFCSDTLRRNFYAVDSVPSGWYISLADDPESVFGDTGLLNVAEGNGQARTAVREYNGSVYLMKEESGFALTVSADDPSTWDPVPAWTGSGPCGFRAVDVCTRFMCFVHRSGVYIFTAGQPVLISKEVPISWGMINWAYKQTIWVTIDDETREILIGIPYGQSAVPNMVLKCNYEESPSFVSPIEFSSLQGKEISSGKSYKWSVDDLPANLVVRMKRPLVNPGAVFPLQAQQSQLLFASSNPDGAISAQIPYLFQDNGVGIDSVYETACAKKGMQLLKLGGVMANIGGAGKGLMEVLSWRARDPKEGGIVPPGGQPQAKAGAVIPMKKEWEANVPYACGAKSAQNERFRLRISNGARKDVGFDISYAAIMAQSVSSARPR